jgi:hypothetical protein
LNQYYIEGAKREIIKTRKILVKFNLHSFLPLSALSGLGHILDVEKATSARSVDAKIFNKEDARFWQMLLQRLSKRLIREVRSCKTVIEAIGWLRDKYGEDGTQQQVTAIEQGGPQKMVERVKCHCCKKWGHVKRDCPDKPGSGVNSGRGKKWADRTQQVSATEQGRSQPQEPCPIDPQKFSGTSIQETPDFSVSVKNLFKLCPHTYQTNDQKKSYLGSLLIGSTRFWF